MDREDGGFTLDGMKLAIDNRKVHHGLVIKPFKAELPEFDCCIMLNFLIISRHNSGPSDFIIDAEQFAMQKKLLYQRNPYHRCGPPTETRLTSQ